MHSVPPSPSDCHFIADANVSPNLEENSNGKGWKDKIEDQTNKKKFLFHSSLISVSLREETACCDKRDQCLIQQFA